MRFINIFHFQIQLINQLEREERRKKMNKMNRKYISLYRQLNIYFDMKKKFVVVYFVKKKFSHTINNNNKFNLYIFFKNK